MKVGFIFATFPSRTETFAVREIESLRKLGLDITVFAAAGQRCTNKHTENLKVFYRPGLLSRDSFSAVRYMLVKYPLALCKLVWLIAKLAGACPREATSLARNLHTVAFFARCLDGEAISQVHAYFLSWPARIGLALSVATGRSLSISAHARDIFVEAGAVGLKASRASFVVTCTQQGMEYLRARLPARCHRKLHLVYHGVGTSSIGFDLHQKGFSSSNSDRVVIAIGRLTNKKGLTVLLRAFALVARKRPQCRLMIAGEGPERERLIELIGLLEIKEHVQLLGWQEPDVIAQLIRQAALLAVPSVVADDGDRDGIPNVILEAFAGKVPVVASDLEGITEAVDHGRTGLLVKAGAVGPLAMAIVELLDNRDLQDRLSQKAYEMAVQRFDRARNARQLAELFLRPH